MKYSLDVEFDLVLAPKPQNPKTQSPKPYPSEKCKSSINFVCLMTLLIYLSSENPISN